MATRAGVVVAAGAGGALALVAAGQTWVAGTVSDLPGGDAVAATGNDLLPVAVPLALIACAGAVVLATAGASMRAVAAAVLVPTGIVLAVAAPAAARHPAASLRPAARRLAGTTEVVVTGTHVTAWPWLVAAAGTAIAAAGLVALARGRAWSGRSPAAGGTGPDGTGADGLPAEARPDPMAAWEALDRGEDPTTHPGSRRDCAGGGAGGGE